jgi:hypothetical protein
MNGRKHKLGLPRYLRDSNPEGSTLALLAARFQQAEDLIGVHLLNSNFFAASSSFFFTGSTLG